MSHGVKGLAFGSSDSLFSGRVIQFNLPFRLFGKADSKFPHWKPIFPAEKYVECDGVSDRRW
jgi:hypothetical protein